VQVRALEAGLEDEIELSSTADSEDDGEGAADGAKRKRRGRGSENEQANAAVPDISNMAGRRLAKQMTGLEADVNMSMQKWCMPCLAACRSYAASITCCSQVIMPDCGYRC
jgi:hypothetical protein